MSTDIPTGVVAFLFTDIEGSTALWASDAEAMSASLATHDEIIRSAIESNGGYVFATGGDSFASAFDRATLALASAAAAQVALANAQWPGPPLKVRMGLHLGETEERNGDYYGTVVNTAARVEAVGHGGQTLITEAVMSSVGVACIDLGEHRLRDLERPVHLWQVGSVDFPPLRTDSTIGNIPNTPTRLLGRDDDIRNVRQLLAQSRAVTITAVGGTGKTRLAIAVAEAESSKRRAGAWFVDLGEISDENEFAPTVANVIGLELRGTDPIGELVEFIAPQEVLVVLDNCEHVVDICAEFAEGLLSRTGPGSILSTSREWLDVDGERTYQVASLPADNIDSPAVKLFVDRANVVDPTFAVSDSNASDVTEICKRLDGMPLAIELAASRIAVLSPNDLVAGLSDRFRMLSGGRRRQRRRTLEATIDWSYDLLDDEEKTAFRSLGVFVGSFDLSAAADVCRLPMPAATDIVEALMAKSLVVGAAPGRFRLLETLKAYAEDRLMADGEAVVVRDRHFGHYLSRVAFDDIGALSDVERQHALLPEVPNILSAADWARSGSCRPELKTLLVGTLFSLSRSGYADEAIERYEAIIDSVDDVRTATELTYGVMGAYLQHALWKKYATCCRKLQSSKLPAYAALGFYSESLLWARTHPDRALGLIEQGDAEHQGGSFRPSVNEGLVHRSFISLYAVDFSTCREIANSFLDDDVGVLGAFSRRSEYFRLRLLHLCDWSDGIRDPDRNYIAPTAIIQYTDERQQQSLDHFLLALNLVSAGDVAVARSSIAKFCNRAITGQLALEANDAVVLLLALAIREGETEIAEHLAMSVGTTRSPLSGSVGIELARRLGLGDLLLAADREAFGDRHANIELPKVALRQEMMRRGWLEQ